MEIIKLLERLKAARFTGELELHLSGGDIGSAKLIHYLGVDQVEPPLPVIEEEQFALKP